MPSSNELDAITIDGFGTLLELEDPTDRLQLALAEHGVERDAAAVRAAFRAEIAFYRPRSLEGRDPDSLAHLRRRCVEVFLEHAGAELTIDPFVPEFMRAIFFRLADGVEAALAQLAAAGLVLACVSNWDVGLIEHLERLGVASRFELILPSALAGFEKPDPRIFTAALDRLGVPPHRALHVGDEEIDRLGAEAAGLAFAPAPLAAVPGQLGL
jgi:putative hydrolase of the HAD superfamily